MYRLNLKSVALPVPGMNNSGHLKILCSPCNHPRSLILVPIESAYANSYLSVILTLVLLCTVSEILQVSCAPGCPHPYSTLIFGVFALHEIAHVGVCPCTGLKLFGRDSREIIVEEFQYVITVLKRNGRTDRQTDNHCGITVASRGNDTS